MARKCSQCGNNGHNSRTCNSNTTKGTSTGGIKLFGVHLEAPCSTPAKNSIAIEAPSSCTSSSSFHQSRPSVDDSSEKSSNSNVSDSPLAQTQDRKKGIAWTEREHMLFLIGLEKLGRGDWRGISRGFVTTRSATQVASHAQKYFLRMTSLDKKKRRSRLFDMGSSSQLALSLKPLVQRTVDVAAGDASAREVNIIKPYFSHNGIIY